MFITLIDNNWLEVERVSVRPPQVRPVPPYGVIARLGPRLGGRNLVFCPFLVEISVVPPLTSASVRLRVRRWLWYSDDDAAAVLYCIK